MKVNNLKFFLLFLLLTFLSLIPNLLFSQVDTAWVRRYNGPSNGSDCAYGISVDHQGNVYVTGQSYDSVSGYDVTTIKYDANGNEVWVRRYNGLENGDDLGNAIALDNFGNLYVTGRSWSSETGFDYITIKYDTNGNEIWVRRYNGPGDSTDEAFAIAVDNSGNVYITGYSYGLDSEKDFATIKYDANGNEIWVRRYNGPGNGEDWAEAIAVDNQGNVYVTGHSFGLNTSSDYVTIKYDSNGNELWVKRYDGPNNYEDVATDLAIDNNGNVYVTGYSSSSSTGKDYATIKYDNEGNEI
ncbi:MAG: SBBP repeat-containing protein [candidate division WOR-3 bacterium]